MLKRVSAVVLALSLAACQNAGTSNSNGGSGRAAPRAPEGANQVCALGEPYKSPQGEIHVIRIQDEYRLLRCIPEGPIAGCWEEVLIVPREALSENTADGIGWNKWLDVGSVPGLQVAFLAPTYVAFREQNPKR